MTKCVICKNWITPTEYGWSYGNNAAPIAEGRCCDDCNQIVILTRMTYNRIRMVMNNDDRN